MKFIGYESYTSWIVTIGVCFINLTSQTPYRIVGLMFVSIVEYYETDRKTASLPILIFIILRCVSGTFCGILGEKLGAENVTLYGSLLAAVGFGVCFFAESIAGLSICLGIIFGIGMTGSNALLPSILKKYFLKNIGSANGIAQAGPCIGAILLPPVVVYFLGEYGLPGTFLILSALMLHAVPISMIIRNASLVQDKIIANTKRNNQESIVDKEANKTTEEMCISKMQSHDDPHIKMLNLDKLLQVEKTNLYFEHKNNNDKSNTENWSTDTVEESVLNRADVSILPSDVTIESKQADLEKKPLTTDVDVQFNGPTSNLPSSIEKHKSKPVKMFHYLRVFLNRPFLIILLLTGLHNCVSVLVWTTIIDYSRDKGISRTNEIYFLMINPFCEIFGRSGFGWLTDLGFLTLSQFSMIAFSLMSLTCGCILWSSEFWMMMIGAMAFAISGGAMTTVFPVMVFACVPEELQNMAIASRYVLTGPLVFSTVPIIGLFRETQGSYDGFYYLLIAICATCVAILPLIDKYSARVKRTKT